MNRLYTQEDVDRIIHRAVRMQEDKKELYQREDIETALEELDIEKNIIAQSIEEYVPRQIPKKFNFSFNRQKQINLPNKDLQFVTDKNLYKEICKYLKTEFPDLDNPLTFSDKVMKQSNTYIAVAVDMYFKSINSEFRIARQSDLETNLQMFKDFYIDSGLALRNLENANKEQAIYLFNQLKQKGFTEKDFPIWINLRGLSLDKNLNFNLTDESLYKTAKCLNWKNGTKYSQVDDFGLPKEEDESSNRQIWTANYALSRCYLGRYSDLISYNSDFSNSNDDGRVVLAKAKD
jgi:hypothetical protein